MVTNPVEEQGLALLKLVREGWNPDHWRDVNVAVAFSGGADSTALVRAALQLKSQSPGAGKLMAMHVNHHLRGAESEDDEHWCREQCRLLGVPFLALDGKLDGNAAADGDGIEAAARFKRYRLLAEASEREGVRMLVTGHTENDQVETVLFRVLRGTGLRGLRGMLPARPLTSSVSLVRPLLKCSRQMVIDYLQQLSQEFRIDRTNYELEFSRNRLRQDLLPRLRSEYNRNVDQAIVRLAEQAGEAQSLIEALAAEVLQKEIGWCPPAQSESPCELKLRVSQLLRHPAPVVTETLRIAWRESGFSEQGMTYVWWRRLARLAMGGASSAVLALPGGFSARRMDGWLRVDRLATPGDST